MQIGVKLGEKMGVLRDRRWVFLHQLLHRGPRHFLVDDPVSAVQLHDLPDRGNGRARGLDGTSHARLVLDRPQGHPIVAQLEHLCPPPQVHLRGAAFRDARSQRSLLPLWSLRHASSIADEDE